MIKRTRIFAAVFALCGVVSLTACDTFFTNPNDGDCHINADYEISCEGDGIGLQTP